MRLSQFFEDLNKAYRAELEDLQSDSEGKNVLNARLKLKRSQFVELMPMIEIAPEMVAVAFHGQVSCSNPQVMSQLAASEPEEFPSWDDLSAVVSFEPAMKKLVEIVLAETGGEQFLITTACLEFLHGKSDGRHAGSFAGSDDEEQNEDDEGRSGNEEDDEGEDIAPDLEEASADWLAEQGFDRRG